MRAWKYLALCLCWLLITTTKGQVIIQPDATSGKDAYIDTFFTPNPGVHFVNHGNSPVLGFGVEECAPDGFNELCRSRLLIDFDLSSLNHDTTFNLAQLVFHTYAINPGVVIDSTVFSIARIVSPWQEDSVVWTNQPAVDTSAMLLFTIKTGMTDSLSIDVTPLLKTQLLQPGTAHGFMLSYTIANRLGNMAGYSSESQTPEWRPKLIVDYPPATVVETKAAETINVYPNPFNQQLIVYTSGTSASGSAITLTNQWGQTILTLSRLTTATTILPADDLPAGIYFLQIREGSSTTTHKLLKIK